jgi:hypothetical protein
LIPGAAQRFYFFWKWFQTEIRQSEVMSSGLAAIKHLKESSALLDSASGVQAVYPQDTMLCGQRVVSFLRRFEAGPDPSGTLLHLFADSRYRIWLNGRFVAFGPGRFVSGLGQYDSYDLGAYLDYGSNELRVEVHFFGTTSYQTLPGGQPIFIAWGGPADLPTQLNTPGDWLYLEHRAWLPEAAHYSFAQNYIEVCDRRILAGELESLQEKAQPVIDEISDRPLSLSPRSVPYPDYEAIYPSKLVVFGEAVQRLEVYGWQAKRPNDNPEERWQAFGCWIWSPREQSVSVQSLWVDLLCNGLEISLEAESGASGIETGRLCLNEGWNYLTGLFEVLEEQWDFLFGISAGVGLRIATQPEEGAPCAFMRSTVGEKERIQSERDSKAPEDWCPSWQVESGLCDAITPSRRMAWLRSASPRRDVHLKSDGSSFPLRVEAPYTLISFDFEALYFGQLELRIKAPRGTVIDVAYDDWQREDGCVGLYQSNPFVHSADRYIAAGGGETILGLNPRGGRYLQLVIEMPADAAPGAVVTVEQVSILRHTILENGTASFQCGIEIIDWAWETSRRTLVSSANETYNDCPWRERGCYLDDTWISMQIQACLSGDLSVAKRCLELFAQAQSANGQFPACVPASLEQEYADFSLIWVLALHDYWRFTGDLEFVRQNSTAIVKLITSLSWNYSRDGLLDGHEVDLFVDWGIPKSERKGAGNTVLNIYFYAALKAAFRLLEAAGSFHKSLLRFIGGELDRMRRVICEKLWIAGEGRFAASLEESGLALHANVLALQHDLGHKNQVLDYLRPHLKANFRAATTQELHTGYLELAYFSKLLPSLAESGECALAEHLIKQHYGYVMENGFLTLPETMNAARTKQGSSCHSWSGSVLCYASRYILGLRPANVGAPDQMCFHPLTSSEIAGARGVVAHPLGDVEIVWERRADTIFAEIRAPKDLRIQSENGVNIILKR